MFKDLKEYQEITKIYHDSVNISEEQRAINTAIAEANFTDEEIIYLDENFDELWEGELAILTEEIIADSLSEENLNEEQIQEIVKKYDGELYPIIRNEGRYGTKSVEIYGFKPSVVYEENWPLLEHTKNAWKEVRTSDVIFINEQFSIRENIKFDDFLELEINDKKLSVRVGGIYADYGNPQNQLMMQGICYRVKV